MLKPFGGEICYNSPLLLIVVPSPRPGGALLPWRDADARALQPGLRRGLHATRPQRGGKGRLPPHHKQPGLDPPEPVSRKNLVTGFFAVGHFAVKKC